MEYQDSGSDERAQANASVVVGLFSSEDDAHRAITQLRESGFSPQQIGAAFRGRSYAYGGSTTTGAVHDHERENWWEKLKDAFRPGDAHEHSRPVDEQSTDTENSYTADRLSGTYNDDEHDLSDIEATLLEIGLPRARAASLTHNLGPGGAIVTVREPARFEEAEEILSNNHGHVRYEDLAGPNFSQDPNATERTEVAESVPNSAQSPSGRPATAGGDRIQLFGEVLRVHKERIRRGEVRLHKEVITEDQTVEVPVTHEELVLERIEVTGETPAPSARIGEGGEVRVPLSGERVTLEKQPVVREEVIVGKREVTNVETVGGNVRREEIRVGNDPDSQPHDSSIGPDVRSDKKGSVEDQSSNLRRPA